MEIYDTSKVGKLIAWSMDHFVYEYGDSQVLKTSKFEFVLGKAGREKSRRDYAICLTYFGEYVLPTEFLACPGSSQIAKIQKRLSGRQLKKRDIADEVIRVQFDDIMKRHAVLCADGIPPLDLVGGHGLFYGHLSNIFVTDDKRLLLIDTSLIEADIPFFRIFLNPILACIRMRQESVIASFMAV